MQALSVEWMFLLLIFGRMANAGTNYYLSGSDHVGLGCTGTATGVYNTTQAVESNVCWNTDPSITGVSASSLIHNCTNGALYWWDYDLPDCTGAYVVSTGPVGTCGPYQLAGQDFSSQLTCYFTPSGGSKYYLTGNEYSGAGCSGTPTKTYSPTVAIESGVCINADPAVYGVVASWALSSCSNGAATWYNYNLADCAGDYTESTGPAGTCGSFQLNGKVFSSTVTCYSTPTGGTKYYLMGNEYSGAACSGSLLLSYKPKEVVQSGICTNANTEYGVSASWAVHSCSNGAVIWWNYNEPNCAGDYTESSGPAGKCGSYELDGKVFSSNIRCFTTPSNSQIPKPQFWVFLACLVTAILSY